MANGGFCNMSHASIASTHSDATDAYGHRHEVQFYESDAFLSRVVARYFANGFRNGNAMVLIARPETRAAFRQQLRNQGFNVEEASSSGQFQEFDARETLGKFMDPELPNAERFGAVLGPVIDECRKRRDDLPVLAYGEMVDILWRDGKHE